MIDTQVISQDTANQVLQRLDALAAKLGVTAQFIYGVYVQQAHVEAIRDVLSATLLLVVGLGMANGSYRLIRWAWRTSESDDWPFIAGIIGCILSLVADGFALLVYYAAIGEWLNPQFWALDALFKAIHG